MAKLPPKDTTPEPDWDEPIVIPPAEPEAVAPAKKSVADANGYVKVRCVVATQPWTDTKPLNIGDEATVPAEVAAAMLKNGQVIIA